MNEYLSAGDQPSGTGEPIPFDDIEQAAVYPICSIQGGSEIPTARDVAVDLWRRNDARTVAAFSRYGLPSVADELSLVSVIRERIGNGWIEPPVSNLFSTLDEKRLAEWREQQ